MSPPDETSDRPSEPPPVDPEVREALDRHEEEIAAPGPEDAADRDEDPEEATEGEAPTG